MFVSSSVRTNDVRRSAQNLGILSGHVLCVSVMKNLTLGASFQ